MTLTRDVDAISHGLADMKLTDPPTQSGRRSKASRLVRQFSEDAKPTNATPHPAPVSVGDLASEIAERLGINPPPNLETSKGKDKEGISDEKLMATHSLQCLQKASQTLSDAVQLGWRAGAPSKDYTKQALRAVVIEAAAHIQILRDSPFTRPIDVERTVIHVAGKLSSLELVRVIAACLLDLVD